MKTANKLKRGQIVEVYEDPITKQRPEGKAKLLAWAQVEPNDGLEYWRVQFLSDKAVVNRWVA